MMTKIQKKNYVRKLKKYYEQADIIRKDNKGFDRELIVQTFFMLEKPYLERLSLALLRGRNITHSKQKAGRPKDKAVLPVLKQSLAAIQSKKKSCSS